MHPKTIRSIFLNGNNLSYLLFKTAIHFAELGLNVWYISQQRIKEIPNNIEPPDKDILKLLTFLYLKDDVELINHLINAHTWHKCPNIIIVSGFENYCSINTESYNSLQAAFVSSVLLNALTACARKHKSNVYLLVACTLLSADQEEKLKKLLYLYFPQNIVRKNVDDDIIFDGIIDMLK